MTKLEEMQERLEATLELGRTRTGPKGQWSTTTCGVRTGELGREGEVLERIVGLKIPYPEPPIELQGPTSLLCGRPTCGAMPWVCEVHWLWLRKAGGEKGGERFKRLRREYKRSLKK